MSRPLISLRKATNRNTPLHEVEYGTMLTLYFSYETIIAFRCDTLGSFMTSNRWGPTTGRHMNELRRDSFTQVDEEAFDKKLEEGMKRALSGTLGNEAKEIEVLSAGMVQLRGFMEDVMHGRESHESWARMRKFIFKTLALSTKASRGSAVKLPRI